MNSHAYNEYPILQFFGSNFAPKRFEETSNHFETLAEGVYRTGGPKGLVESTLIKLLEAREATVRLKMMVGASEQQFVDTQPQLNFDVVNADMS